MVQPVAGLGSEAIIWGVALAEMVLVVGYGVLAGMLVECEVADGVQIEMLAESEVPYGVWAGMFVEYEDVVGCGILAEFLVGVGVRALTFVWVEVGS